MKPNFYLFRIKGPSEIFTALWALRRHAVKAFNKGVVRKFGGEEPFSLEDAMGSEALLHGLGRMLGERYNEDDMKSLKISLPTESAERMRLWFVPRNFSIVRTGNDEYTLRMPFPEFLLKDRKEGSKTKEVQFTGSERAAEIRLSVVTRNRADGQPRAKEHLHDVVSRISAGTYSLSAVEIFHHNYNGWCATMIVQNTDIDCPSCAADSWESIEGGVRCIRCGTFFASDTMKEMKEEHYRPDKNVECGILTGLSSPFVFSSGNHRIYSVNPSDAEHSNRVAAARRRQLFEARPEGWESKSRRIAEGHTKQASSFANKWRKEIYNEVHKSRSGIVWMLRSLPDMNYFSLKNLSFFRPDVVVSRIAVYMRLPVSKDGTPREKFARSVRFMDEEFKRKYTRQFDADMLFRICSRCGRLHPPADPHERDGMGRLPLFECDCGSKMPVDSNAARNLAHGERIMELVFNFLVKQA